MIDLKNSIQSSIQEVENFMNSEHFDENFDDNKAVDMLYAIKDEITDYIEIADTFDPEKDMEPFTEKVNTLLFKLGYISEEELNEEYNMMFPDENAEDGFNWNLD